ncbi:hypothetical protein ACQJBY_029819 [Aegilops geniculata]
MRGRRAAADNMRAAGVRTPRPWFGDPVVQLLLVGHATAAARRGACGAGGRESPHVRHLSVQAKLNAAEFPFTRPRYKLSGAQLCSFPQMLKQSGINICKLR